MNIKIHIDTVVQQLLQQEDTEGNKRITIEDCGPKQFEVVLESGEKQTIKGAYHLSNLLQELVVAKKDEVGIGSISLADIRSKPVARISKMIRDHYWQMLTRQLDEKGIKAIVQDEKSSTSQYRLYIPFHDRDALEYYKELVKNIPSIHIEILPEQITPEYVWSINDQPGILALGLDQKTKKGIPFVVPGGRFNEMYGWDSYFINVGLLLDDKQELAKGMIDNFVCQITHYGKILNANRSYFLTRTQPPFFTSMLLEYCKRYQDGFTKDWLRTGLQSALKEHQDVWSQEGERLLNNGLNRFCAQGIGLTPETEEGHHNHILEQYKPDSSVSLETFEEQYLYRKIEHKALDDYFVHDRSGRESGHDTTYRFDDRCADFATVDLNALLYKYEKDLAHIIEHYFGGTFEWNGQEYTADYWLNAAQQRVEQCNTLLWNAEKGNYYDYDVANKKQSQFEAATSFYPLWAKMCSDAQAKEVVAYLLPKLKSKGGVAGCTKEALKNLPKDAIQRQWDYPHGWAPHQMMIWKGLLNYGFEAETKELVYRWLWMIIKNAIDYSGVLPEKFDVVNCTFKTDAEYGNVGAEFEYIPDGGFGWMNASYQLGVTLLDETSISDLNSLKDPDLIFI